MCLTEKIKPLYCRAAEEVPRVPAAGHLRLRSQEQLLPTRLGQLCAQRQNPRNLFRPEQRPTQGDGDTSCRQQGNNDNDGSFSFK